MGRSSLKLATKVAIDENGFVDIDGEPYATVLAFWDSLQDDEPLKSGTTCTALHHLVSRACVGVEARNRINRDCKVFSVKEMRRVAEDFFLHTARVDPETGMYIGESDDCRIELASRTTWCEIFKVTMGALKKGIDDIYGGWDLAPRAFGISRRGARDPLYKRSTIRAALSYILDFEYQVEDGVLNCKEPTREGISGVFHSLWLLEEEIGVDGGKIKGKLKANGHQPLKGVDRHSGNDEVLYSFAAARVTYEEQMRVILNAEANGTVIEPAHGLCLTVNQYLSSHPEVSQPGLKKLVKSNRILRFRRIDPRTGRIHNYYPVTELDKFAILCQISKRVRNDLKF